MSTNKLECVRWSRLQPGESELAEAEVLCVLRPSLHHDGGMCCW